ncbi:MAG: T9SS type A sorting domain-containing protein [Spirosomaceae bacterium]|nr:T9SS type A sorting domain-containing protein [Spirosomataceae bacterium]
MGGKNNEFAYSVVELSDGSLVMVGSTNSGIDGDVVETKGMNDMWVVKTKSNGQIEWSKCFGGTKDDIATDVIETTDKAILVVGTTNSVDGDAQGSGSRGGLLLLKIRTNGTLEWKRVFAGGYNASETGYLRGDGSSKPSLKNTADGGYILGATRDGGISTGYREYDFWLAKLNALGIISWQQHYGSSRNDIMNEVVLTSDGGYIMLGSTEGQSNEILGAGRGFFDTYIVKVSANGTQQWQRAFGGSSFDAAYSASETSDRGFVVVGETTSRDFDFQGNLGQKDGFIIRLNAAGQLLWRIMVGGIENDGINHLEKVNNQFIGFGFSGSTFSGAKPNSSLPDFWMINFTESGTINYNKLWGGGDEDLARCGIPTKDGSFVVVGQSQSVDGDITNIRGNLDFWAIKVGTPLPAYVATFNANINTQQNIQLTWESTYETSVRNYHISRSSNGTNYTRLTSVATNGNLTQRRRYNYVDTKPIVGKNYYQLSYTDANNRETIVSTSVVSFIPTSVESQDPNLQVVVYPNPSDGSEIFVNSTIPNSAINLYDTQGRSVAIDVAFIEPRKASIKPTQKLPSGIYFITLPHTTHRILVR